MSTPLDYRSKRKSTDGRGNIRLTGTRSQGELLVKRLPRYCCTCLVPTMEVWRLPTFYGPELKIHVIICATCKVYWQRRLRKYIGCGFVAAVLLGLGAAGVSVALGGIGYAPWMCGLLAFAVATLLVSYTSQFFALPVKLGLWSSYNTGVRLRFRNAAYAAMVEDALG